MITCFYFKNNHLKSGGLPGTEPAAPLVWVDLLNPEPAEIEKMDKMLRLNLPTQEEMREIETSSRLYEEDGAHYMTMTYVSNALGDLPETTPLTFVLKDHMLVTMRYKEMRFLSHMISKAEARGGIVYKTGPGIMIMILENITDICADVLEKNNTEIESISRRIFGEDKKSREYKKSLEQIAKIGETNSKIRESLVSLSRLQAFLHHALDRVKAAKDSVAKLRTLSADIHSLLDHAAFVSGKINFILDATLGLVNIEQNGIIKIFSVAAVIFLPPTLIASIYGMNFHHMPELDWSMGYPMAVGMMIVSAILPYLYFKHKDWL